MCRTLSSTAWTSARYVVAGLTRIVERASAFARTRNVWDPIHTIRHQPWRPVQVCRCRRRRPLSRKPSARPASADALSRAGLSERAPPFDVECGVARLRRMPGATDWILRIDAADVHAAAAQADAAFPEVRFLDQPGDLDDRAFTLLDLVEQVFRAGQAETTPDRDFAAAALGFG